ncbi:DNA-binding IclR family transcriptional regulator [Sphingomonas sp. F9_3S_D5_B_2]
MRRPAGQAAEMILKAVSDAHPEGLTYAQLGERCRLPGGTIHENVRALRKQGKIESFKGDDGAAWICLPE